MDGKACQYSFDSFDLHSKSLPLTCVLLFYPSGNEDQEPSISLPSLSIISILLNEGFSLRNNEFLPRTPEEPS